MILASIATVLTSQIFCVCWGLEESSSTDTLLFAQVIFRHGHRNPRHTFGEYSKNVNLYWPEGLSQLTDTGKLQAYELGRFLRDRYDGLLDESYRQQELMVISSPILRTIKTADISLMALYKKFNDAAPWTKSLNIGVPPYEPIPVRTIPEEMDHLLSLNKADCPARKKIKSDVYASNFEKRYYENESQVLEYVFKQSGKTALFDLHPNSTKTHEEYYAVQDLVNWLVSSNKSLENWMIPLTHNEKFLAYSYHLQVAEHVATVHAQRLNVGLLTQIFLDNFASFINGTLVDKKIFLVSAHDKNVLSLMFALGINSILSNRLPPYGSSLHLELHQLPKYDEPVIEFWFRNVTTSEFKKVDSNICGNPCTLDKLIDATAALINVDFDEECRIK